MTRDELRAAYRKAQISIWDFAPDGAFRVFRNVDTGLSKTTCEFVFYERDGGALVRDDCSDALKSELTAAEPWI